LKKGFSPAPLFQKLLFFLYASKKRPKLRSLFCFLRYFVFNVAKRVSVSLVTAKKRVVPSAEKAGEAAGWP